MAFGSERHVHPFLKQLCSRTPLLSLSEILTGKKKSTKHRNLNNEHHTLFPSVPSQKKNQTPLEEFQTEGLEYRTLVSKGLEGLQEEKEVGDDVTQRPVTAGSHPASKVAAAKRTKRCSRGVRELPADSVGCTAAPPETRRTVAPPVFRHPGCPNASHHQTLTVVPGKGVWEMQGLYYSPESTEGQEWGRGPADGIRFSCGGRGGERTLTA